MQRHPSGILVPIRIVPKLQNLKYQF